MDNAVCHLSAEKLDLSHVEIVYLPPNMTAKLQPLDAGVIRSIKARDKKNFVSAVCRRN